ncbi:Protein of unknown function UPF0147 [Ignisphaera aggregans DSM 17230]|uniref:UPF0147 protein Igag_0474 n=1 Tax=Ignisphaera aggregans (strain DSM 17230 / JCM 13409 / AQ1.S1) TaxID=583356 RepID=E0SRN7_IGNAA|nr:Protein of unknown function UPF0147 [Ignisphaera aggregans DSM 17230]
MENQGVSQQGDVTKRRFESKAMQYDNEAKIKQALLVLSRVMNDPSIPRNIRRAAMFAIRALNEKGLSPGVRAANAVGILDEVSQDPNMPLHARTLLWSAITILETVKD